MKSSKITDTEFFTRVEEIKEILVGRGYDAPYVERCVNGSGAVLFTMQPFMTAAKQAEYLEILFSLDEHMAITNSNR